MVTSQAPCSQYLAMRRVMARRDFMVTGDTGPARRAEHFFTETVRVAEGAQLWEAGDIAAFGTIMNRSGRSSAENYEVLFVTAVLSCMAHSLWVKLLCDG